MKKKMLGVTFITGLVRRSASLRLDALRTYVNQRTFTVLALARQMESERRTQTVLGAERRRGHVPVLRRQSNGVHRHPVVGRSVREHGSAAATGSERDSRVRCPGAHHSR